VITKIFDTDGMNPNPVKGDMVEEIEATPLLAPAKSSTATQATEEDSAGGHILIPLCERSILARLDVGPFLFCYCLLVFLDVLYPPVQHHAIHWISELGFPLVLLTQASLFFLQQWNVFWRAFVGYRKTKISSMTHCLVEAPHVDKHQSSHDAQIVSAKLEDDVAVVAFQNAIFRSSTTDDADIALWESGDLTLTASAADTQRSPSFHPFQRLRYPIHLPMAFYRNWNGFTSLQKLVQAQQVYGSNTTPIELPPFLDLLQEQVVAPFFLFQVLCVLLWCLDECQFCFPMLLSYLKHI
jgi:hypothetical protein